MMIELLNTNPLSQLPWPSTIKVEPVMLVAIAIKKDNREVKFIVSGEAFLSKDVLDNSSGCGGGDLASLHLDCSSL